MAGHKQKSSLPSIFGHGAQPLQTEHVLPYHSSGSNGAAYDTRQDGFHGSGPGQGQGRGSLPALTGSAGFDFDEDDEVQIREREAARRHFRGKGKLREAFEDIWDKVLEAAGQQGRRKDLAGERTIHINDPGANDQFRYMNNYVSTGKYNLVTFIPKFLAGECTFTSVCFWRCCAPYCKYGRPVPQTPAFFSFS